MKLSIWSTQNRHRHNHITKRAFHCASLRLRSLRFQIVDEIRLCLLKKSLS
jgi:hypothetical protein